jgi:glycosyltransferase involved in cell wall biosynthesis
MLLENNPYPQDARVRHEARSLVEAGHSVEVIAPRWRDQPAREDVNGVTVRRFRAINESHRGVLSILAEYTVATVALHVAALRSLLRGGSVLHLHNPPDTLFLAGAMFRLARRRVVFDHHDLGPELVAVRLRRRALVAAARVAERLTFAVANHVLATNESYAELAQLRGGKCADQVTVVRNGPPQSWTDRPLCLREGRLAKVRLAYVGTIAAQDGLDGVAEILARLRDRVPAIDARLTVVGDGDERPSFERALRRFGVSDRVRVTGWVSSDQVPILLAESDVCIDPAPSTPLNDRSTMIKLAEYMALAKPVVAYDLLETRRTVRDAALLVAPGDKRRFAEQIELLAADPLLRSTLAHRARARARELTWERSELALLEAYARVSGDRTRPRSGL